MSEVVLYHHMQGLTDGVRSFADGCDRPVTPCTRRTCSTAGRSRRSRREWRSRARPDSGRSGERGVAAGEAFRATSSTRASPSG